MRTIGEILKNAREKKNISLEDAAKATKIRINFLRDLEENRFAQISEATVVKGFIKNYAEYLSLSSLDALAILRRDFIENAKGQILPRGTYEPLGNKGFSWTPKMTIFTVTLLVFSIILGYFLINLISLNGAPLLKITSPENNETFLVSGIRIEGKTDTDAVVLINNQLIGLETDGSFEYPYVLSPGDNKIKIEATSRRNKKSSKEITVKYNPS